MEIKVNNNKIKIIITEIINWTNQVSFWIHVEASPARVSIGSVGAVAVYVFFYL